MAPLNQLKVVEDEKVSGVNLVSEKALEIINNVAPLWPLERFVSVHPFVYEKDQSLLSLSKKVNSLFESSFYPSPSFFRKLYTQGAFSRYDLEKAILDSDIPADHLPTRTQMLKLLDEAQQDPKKSTKNKDHHPLVLPSHVLETDKKLNGYFSDHFGKWAASIFSQERSLFALRDKTTHFYETWRRLLKKDMSLTIQGFGSLKTELDKLSMDFHLVLAEVQEVFGLDEQDFEKLILKCSYEIPGWTAYARFLDRESHNENSPDSLALQVVAARLSYELALIKSKAVLLSEWKSLWPKSHDSYDYSTRDIILDCWLRAAEIGLQSRISNQLVQSRNISSRAKAQIRPQFQFVLCIDARSEILRRNLEGLSSSIETVGFAGFFGLTLASRSEFGEISSRCPVLLEPSIIVQQSSEATEHDSIITWKPLSLLNEAIKKSAITTFSYVEALGLGYLVGLISRTLKLKRHQTHVSSKSPRLVDRNQVVMSLASKVAFAQGFLKNSSLMGRLGEVVVLTGHGSETQNNAHASGLDCGACGGHKGDINAVVAASILNNEDVRARLRGTDFEIPDSTRFVAALHNTTTQEILLQEPSLEKLDATVQSKLQEYIKKAVELANQERAFLESRSAQSDPSAEALMKSRDWSDVQPEWGLARNALFIAGRRGLTKGMNLEGRSFLHDYDQSKDGDSSVLELILTAPLVVAQWINAQYYMSAVDPKNFGAGTKVLHNVMGSIGVFEGASYQLKTGLPEQSVFSQGQYFHQPLRLQVFVEATCDSIDAIVSKHSLLQTLIAARWITLSSIDPKTGMILKRGVKGQWSEV